MLIAKYMVFQHFNSLPLFLSDDTDHERFIFFFSEYHVAPVEHKLMTCEEVTKSRYELLVLTLADKADANPTAFPVVKNNVWLSHVDLP